MKFTTALLSALTFSAISFAQQASITEPQDGANIEVGCQVKIRVETRQIAFIDSPDAKITHLGLVLDISAKESNTNQNITQILYTGAYEPKAPDYYSNLTEEFTVTIPADFRAGPAVLRSYYFGVVEVEALDRVAYNTSSVNVNVVKA